MLRLGRVDYLNVLPIYHAFDSGAIPLSAEFVTGVPALLNKKFLAGELDITPISSIEYARQPQAGWVLPDVSISADGRVASILLFTRLPVQELDERKIAVTTSSATSVVLLQILLEKYYGVHCQLHPMLPDLESMLSEYPAALLIGDDALVAAEQLKAGFYEERGCGSLRVIDLGEIWKEMTGLPMVFALWAIRSEYVKAYGDRIDQVADAFRQARAWGLGHQQQILEEAQRRYILPVDLLSDYFHTIRYDLDDTYQYAVETFYDYAAEIGVLTQRVKLKVWGENG